MGTAERQEALENDVAAPLAAVHGFGAPEDGVPDEYGVPVGPEKREGAAVHGGAKDISTSQDIGRGKSVGGTEPSSASTAATQLPSSARAEPRPSYRQLWVEEPARRRRLPDPVRTAAVRAVLVIAVTLIQAMVAFLSTLAGSWLAFPMVLSSVGSTVVATWAALDVWVTRQVWNQRNGVVSIPSSTARALRRERRKARRQASTAARTPEQIRGQGGGTGQLSHP